jgi:hypothetical protein
MPYSCCVPYHENEKEETSTVEEQAEKGST